MPEYLAPGVYVEETSFRSKSIEGVSTTTTGFIGPTRYGPVTQTPDIVTSLGDFERVYGGGEQLEFQDGTRHNYLWHGVRAFFSEGGKRLYVSRVFRPVEGQEYVPPGEEADGQPDTVDASAYKDGHARLILGTGGTISIRARFPGKAGNMRLRLALRLGGKLPRTLTGGIQAGVTDLDLIYVQQRATGTLNVQNLLTDLNGAAGPPATDGATDEATKVAGLVNAFVDTPIENSADAAIKALAAVLEVNLREAIRLAEQAGEQLRLAEKDRADAQAIVDSQTATASEKAQAKRKVDAAKLAINVNASAAVLAARSMEAQTRRASKSVKPADQTNATKAADNTTTKLAGVVTAAGDMAVTGKFLRTSVSDSGITLSDKTQQVILAPEDQVRSVILRLELIPVGSEVATEVWNNIAIDPKKVRNGVADSIFDFFALEPANQDQARTLPIIVRRNSSITTGLQALDALFGDVNGIITKLDTAIHEQKQPEVSNPLTLIGGNDGKRPGASEYEGKANPEESFKTGLKQFEDLEDISIVAAPGSSYGYQNGSKDDAIGIAQQLLIHASTMRYRIAVLDSGEDLSISAVREQRARYDSKYGAFYYPWVRILDPITRQELDLPPSGFVAGIYARNDINRAVWKAPANEVVNLALGFEKLLNKAQQDVLNPEGINCFRFFEGRGMLLWGARTISSDPEWKYVNLRRYFAYLERSIDKGTQWAVFEPNGEALWANVRRTIEDFLLNEWQMGALLGDKPEKAYFVKCDRSTMTQNDLDNGRLICLVGVAPLRPAEFVIFRIGQWTGDRKV